MWFIYFYVCVWYMQLILFGYDLSPGVLLRSLLWLSCLFGSHASGIPFEHAGEGLQLSVGTRVNWTRACQNTLISHSSTCTSCFAKVKWLGGCFQQAWGVLKFHCVMSGLWKKQLTTFVDWPPTSQTIFVRSGTVSVKICIYIYSSMNPMDYTSNHYLTLTIESIEDGYLKAFESFWI